jgi:hypothetical protein
MTNRKPLKVGVWEGGGSPMGYLWTVAILDIAFEEALATVGERGYSHFAMQFKIMATSSDPTHCEEVDVRSVEDFYEVRDGGGVCGNVNVRVFFGMDMERRTIITLGTIKKQNNGPTPQGTKITMRRRLRCYRNGDYGFLS